MEDRVRFALEKLLNVAHEDTGQGRRMANFLLAWWKAEVHGGFDLTDLANVDPQVSDDIAIIFTYLAREEDAVYATDYRGEIEEIIARWRPLPYPSRGGAVLRSIGELGA
ncbi:DUF7673 family protein [Rhizobium mayense]|uniref:DUF7673 domain-containing protein n=1 Tax=Rhizobium mayense TaxID=1312184 RepID=A0ABT7K598_9HYPH|nr:hypothetical protein [Rhizobium mayense]MDL2403777.1 hypothetical protein [Rhizobium mayense]